MKYLCVIYGKEDEILAMDDEDCIEVRPIRPLREEPRTAARRTAAPASA